MADQRFLYTEEVVGANHPSKSDTINRLALVEHNNDGTHDFQNNQFQNILKNGSFESWSAGTSSAPDGWSIFGTGATIARDGTNYKIGTYGAALTRVGNDAGLRFATPSNIYYRSRTITFGCWVRATVANRARLSLSDDVASTPIYSSYHTGGSGWEFLTITYTVDAAATTVTIDGRVDGGDTTVQFDGAILVEGSSAPAFFPHPNDEHLKAVDYQDSVPANYDYGLLRMECGQANIVFSSSGAAAVGITFGTAFSKILIGMMTNNDGTSVRMFTQVQALAITGMTLRLLEDDDTPITETDTVYWIAIGVD